MWSSQSLQVLAAAAGRRAARQLGRPGCSASLDRPARARAVAGRAGALGDLVGRVRQRGRRRSGGISSRVRCRSRPAAATARTSPSRRGGARRIRRHPRLAHWPYCRRSASESGRRAARIAACAPAMSYSARRHSAVQALGVEHQPGRARVAVARLAGRARVDQPLAGRDVELGRPRAASCRSPARPRGGGRTARRASGRSARRGSRVASKHSSAVSAGEHVLPDRVARRGVEEPDALGARPAGCEREQELARLGRRSSPASSWAASAAPREKSSSESTLDDRQVVVAGQADRAVARRPARRRRPGSAP